MAKRYLTFEQLANQGTGAFKPGSTLGSHHAIIESISNSGIVVSGSSAKGRVTLRPGWTLGYDCGKVWLIKPANLISDPLIQVLRELKISKHNLKISDEEIRVFCEYTICGAGYGSSGTTIKTLGKGWKRRYQGREEGEYYSGGEVGIVYSHRCDRNFGQTRTVVDFVVTRSHVSRERAASLIRRELIEKPASEMEARRKAHEEIEQRKQKATAEFNDFLENENWKAIAAPFLADLVLREKADKMIWPYTMCSTPKTLFPVPVDGSTLWSNSSIVMVLESQMFRKIAIQHREVSESKNNDPLSHLCKQLSAFVVEFQLPESIQLPESNREDSFEEKKKKIASLTSFKSDLTEFIEKNLT